MTSLEYARLETQIMDNINPRDATAVDGDKGQDESLIRAKPLTMQMLQSAAFIVLGMGYIFGSNKFNELN
jgi:hypothetical protein